MISGYFRLDDNGIMRPYIDLDVDFHAPLNGRIRISFVVDTGADRTLLSAHVARDLERRFNFDIRSLRLDSPLGGIGGQVDTRSLDVTLSQDRFWIAMPVSVIDAFPGPNTAPSLLGRDMLDYFALFIERRTHSVFLLDAGEADDFVNLPISERR